MRSNRMKNTSPPRRKRSAIKRVKPQRGTLPLLITLSVFVVAMIFFAPKIAQTPAANVSGTEVDEARRFQRRHKSAHHGGDVLQPQRVPG